MRTRVPIMIQDPTVSGYPGLKRIVERPDLDEPVFSDGPACPRVVIDDVDLASGVRRPAVPFEPPAGGRKLGRYRIANEDDIYAPDFMAVSAFGTVLHTVHMFEEADTLGRPLAWATGAPQVVVVPRAGEKANAFYSRTPPNLRFFYFANPRDRTHKVYTCLSRDIVAHETGHAILDGIAPRLWNAITPQSLAMHEAVADLVAVVMSFRSGNLRKAVLAQTRGSIEDVGAFSSIGDEFGQAQNLACLRDLRSNARIQDVDASDVYGLSQVLSAALYKMIVGMHDRWWARMSGDGAARTFSASGKALAVAADQFKRMVFRALDYLPPAEVSFADFGRAIIAADQASHPDDPAERDFIREEFRARGIVNRPEALDVETDFEHAAVTALDLAALVGDDAVANAFAEANRDLLHIPARAKFHVEPRLDVTKLYYHRGLQRQRVRECLLKVWWTQTEHNALGLPWPQKREISVGTTLAVDWQSRRVRALLTSDRRARPAEGRAQRSARDAILGRVLGRDRAGADRAADSGIEVDVSGGVMRVRSMARMLQDVEGSGRAH